jgi:hypothetical protein
VDNGRGKATVALGGVAGRGNRLQTMGHPSQNVVDNDLFRKLVPNQRMKTSAESQITTLSRIRTFPPANHMFLPGHRMMVRIHLETGYASFIGLPLVVKE